MPQESNKQCLDDSIVVDTSTRRFRPHVSMVCSPRWRGEPPQVARRSTLPTDRVTPRNHSLISAEERRHAT